MQLELTEDEARTLVVILSCIGGSSTKSPRKHTASVLKKLNPEYVSILNASEFYLINPKCITFENYSTTKELSTTQLSKMGFSPVEICRGKGWNVGTVIKNKNSPEGYTITGLGEKIVLGKDDNDHEFIFTSFDIYDYEEPTY